MRVSGTVNVLFMDIFCREESMSDIKQHCRDCIELLGKEFYEIHRWLDQYVKLFPIGSYQDYHRSFLHNSYGIEIIKVKWGGEAERAAKIHLARDFDDQAPIGRLPKLTNKAIMWFNNLTNMEVSMCPDVVVGWGGRSLVDLVLRR